MVALAVVDAEATQQFDGLLVADMLGVPRCPKATLRAAWTAVLVNLHPIAGALHAQTA